MEEENTIQNNAFCLLIILLALVNCVGAQGTWKQKVNFGGVVREGAIGFSINTKGYIGTGFDGGGMNYYSDFWEWDQIGNVWTQKASLLTPRYRGVGFSIGTKGYMGTGWDAIGGKQDFWEWDQATNQWTGKANFITTRWMAVGFSIGNKGYIGTGNGSIGRFNDFWEWDGDTASSTYNTWTQKANFGGTARRGAVGFSVGNKGYIGTGNDADSLRSDFWEWDGDTASPAYNTWSKKANFGGTAREGAVGFCISTKGYIGTGYDGTNRKDFWEWDNGSDTWTPKTNFIGTARLYAVGFSIGTQGYIGTGYDGISPAYVQQDFWEYCDTCTIGINELHTEWSVSIFPNPTGGVVAINANLIINKIDVYNVQGEKVYSSSKMTNSIDLSEQLCGVYFFYIKTAKGILTKKIIVQR